MFKLPVVKMLFVVLKSLFTGSACKMYPVCKQEVIKESRGFLNIEPSLCILCSLCSKKCPADALVVNREDRTWEVDRMKCITCGACVEACPKKCLILLPERAGSSIRKQKTDQFNIPIEKP
ncbi:MAG: 4Fe-4S binding protein [Candidatus Theseobacter exili]|nr:4Fe-4S binding protein [Candidatus Theseobacter exili]